MKFGLPVDFETRTYPVPRNSYINVIKLQNINVKKLQFRQELTANDVSKTAKITKR